MGNRINNQIFDTSWSKKDEKSKGILSVEDCESLFDELVKKAGPRKNWKEELLKISKEGKIEKGQFKKFVLSYTKRKKFSVSLQKESITISGTVFLVGDLVRIQGREDLVCILFL